MSSGNTSTAGRCGGGGDRGRAANGERRAVRWNGAASRPKLSEVLFAVLEQKLAMGPVPHGGPDRNVT